MAEVSLQKAEERPVSQAQPWGGLRFDITAIALGTVLIAGVYTDLWAHAHLPPDSETFFTPWHAVLYGGYLLNAIFLLTTFFVNRSRGGKGITAMPVGYYLALFGVGLFLFAGVGDMFWHKLLGAERNIETSFSPPHLALVVGATLIFTGPFCAAWARKDSEFKPTLLMLLPALLAISYAIAAFDVVTAPGQPFTKIWPLMADTSKEVKVAGIFGIIALSMLWTGTVLLLVRRWRLPFGAITLFLLVYTALLSLRVDYHVEAMLIGGLSGLILDGLVLYLKPSVKRVGELRIFAFLVPVVILSLYFFTQYLLAGKLMWSTHLWGGALFVSGIAGLLLSLLVAPPAIPLDTDVVSQE